MIMILKNHIHVMPILGKLKSMPNKVKNVVNDTYQNSAASSFAGVYCRDYYKIAWRDTSAPMCESVYVRLCE